jgi:hypothetical protein
MNEANKNFISDKAKKPLEMHVNKILKEINAFGDFGLKNRGEVSDELVDKVFEVIKKKLATAKKQFKATENLDEFKIEDLDN